MQGAQRQAAPGSTRTAGASDESARVWLGGQGSLVDDSALVMPASGPAPEPDVAIVGLEGNWRADAAARNRQ